MSNTRVIDIDLLLLIPPLLHVSRPPSSLELGVMERPFLFVECVIELSFVVAPEHGFHFKVALRLRMVRSYERSV